MAWEVVFSARSRSDLEQIVRYIARDDPEAAQRFGSKLIQRAEFLGDAPEMGPELPQKLGTKFFPFGSYLIIYRSDAKRGIVRILRFWRAPRTTYAVSHAGWGSPHATQARCLCSDSAPH